MAACDGVEAVASVDSAIASADFLSSCSCCQLG